MRKIFFQPITFSLFLLILLYSYSCKNHNKIEELTADGTWCWFSDPRAIYNENVDQLITGFVTEDGSVVSLHYSLKNGETSTSVLNEKLEVDDHNNPAFVQRPDGRYLAFYTKHHNRDLYMNMSTNPNDASSWEPAISINPNGKADLEKYGDDKYTYANPFLLKSENNRIYLFGRWIGFKPNMSWSDDGGLTWADSRVVVSPEPFSWGQRPYVKYYADGLSKIHLVFTDGHPRDELSNSVYYACYFNGAFHRANGEVICALEDLPFEPREATLVYDASISGIRSWVFDIFADEAGNPSIAYARYPSEEEHIYYYTWFDGSQWFNKEVVNSGKWFPQTPDGETEREPHYSGGMSISPNAPHTIYASVERNGVFEIENWRLENNKWLVKPITKNSSNNQVRPYTVKNAKDQTLLLWNSVDRYIHYTNFRTSLQFIVENEQ